MDKIDLLLNLDAETGTHYPLFLVPNLASTLLIIAAICGLDGYFIANVVVMALGIFSVFVLVFKAEFGRDKYSILFTYFNLLVCFALVV